MQRTEPREQEALRSLRPDRTDLRPARRRRHLFPLLPPRLGGRRGVRRLRPHPHARHPKSGRTAALRKMLDAAPTRLHSLREDRASADPRGRRAPLRDLLPALAPTAAALQPLRGSSPDGGPGHLQQPGSLLVLQHPSIRPVFSMQPGATLHEERRRPARMPPVPGSRHRPVLNLRPDTTHPGPLAAGPRLRRLLRPHPRPSGSVRRLRNQATTDRPRRQRRRDLRALFRTSRRLPLPKLRARRTPLCRGTLPAVHPDPTTRTAPDQPGWSQGCPASTRGRRPGGG